MAGFDPKAYAQGDDGDTAQVAAPFDPKAYAAGVDKPGSPGIAAALGLSMPASLADAGQRLATGGIFHTPPPDPATDENGRIKDMTAAATAAAGADAPAFPLFPGAGLGNAVARVAANAGLNAADAGLKRGADGAPALDPGAAAHAAGVAGGLSAGLEALPYVGSAAARVAGPVLNAGTNLIGKAVYTVGHVFTGMDVGDALRAQNSMSAAEMMLPDAFIDTAGKAVGDARKVMQAQNITVPDSHAVAQNVIGTIEEAKSRGIIHPNADKVIDAIRQRAFETVNEVHTTTVPPWEQDAFLGAKQSNLTDLQSKLQQIDAQRGAAVAQTLQQAGQELTPENIAAAGQIIDQHPAFQQIEGLRGHLLDQHDQLAAEVADLTAKRAAGIPLSQSVTVPKQTPRDLTLPELDDLTGMMDELGFNASGSPKQLRRIWAPAVAGSRGALNEVMQTVPEGQLFQAEKDPFRNLSMASQLNTGMRVTVVGGALSSAASAASMAVGHAALAPGALVMASLQPRSYFALMGALKVPQDVVGMFNAASASGKVGMMRGALDTLSQQNPALAESLIRGATLISNKPLQNQFLTAEEANSLGQTRIFDAGQIAAEKQRINSDMTLDSVEKSAALSAINRNGYVTMDGPKAPPPQVQADDGEDKVQSLFRSLKSVGN